MWASTFSTGGFAEKKEGGLSLGGVASLSDRWSSNPCQDFIESVAPVTGYSCERLPPPGAAQTGQNKSRPLVALWGPPVALHPKPWVQTSRAKWSNGVFPVGRACLIWGLAGKASSWNTRGDSLCHFVCMCVCVCVCVCVWARLHMCLLLLLCAWPVAVTHFTWTPSLIQTELLFL